MSTSDNKATVRRYYDEIWTRGNLALIDQLFAPEYRNHDPATPGKVVSGRDAFKAFVGSYREAMPDFKMEIVEQFAEGELVCSRWFASGTQRGALLGIAPTGRFVSGIEGVTLTRFAAGRIVEDRALWDTAGLLRALGVLGG